MESQQQGSCSYVQAQEIMRGNLVGPEHCPQGSVDDMPDIPYSESQLRRQSVWWLHRLYFVPAMSILDMAAWCGDLFAIKKGTWYADKKFAHERGEKGWHLLPIHPTPVPEMATVDCAVFVSARVLTYMLCVNESMGAKRPQGFALSSTLSPYGRPVVVGFDWYGHITLSEYHPGVRGVEYTMHLPVKI